MSRLGPRTGLPIRLTPRLTVDHLLWVANTRHGPAAHWHARVAVDGPDHDHLADPREARAYLAAHHVPVPPGLPDEGQLARLAVVREGVRALQADGATQADQGALAGILRAARFRIDLDGGLVTAGDGWDGLIDDLVPPYLELLGMRDRIRVCGNPFCRLLFVDQSKGRSRRWCDSGGCGNRFRVARHRHVAAERTAAENAVGQCTVDRMGDPAAGGLGHVPA